MTVHPCTLCEVFTSAPAVCSMCTQGLAGFDLARLANARVAAAVVLYLAARPGVPLDDALCARLADLAAELGVTTGSGLDGGRPAAGPPREPFWWMPPATGALVSDVVRQLAGDRRRANEDRQALMAARMASTLNPWGNA